MEMFEGLSLCHKRHDERLEINFMEMLDGLSFCQGGHEGRRDIKRSISLGMVKHEKTWHRKTLVRNCRRIMERGAASSKRRRVCQIAVLESIRQGTPVLSTAQPIKHQNADTLRVQEAMSGTLSLWPADVIHRIPPSHIFLPQHHVEQLGRIPGPLNKALTDIVERWTTDLEANFPSKVPLESHEEQLLKVNSPPDTAVACQVLRRDIPYLVDGRSGPVARAVLPEQERLLAS